VLAPATFVVVVVAIAVGVAQTRGVWSTVLIMATASVGIQIGYFLGILIQYGLVRSRHASHLVFLTRERRRIIRSLEHRFLNEPG